MLEGDAEQSLAAADNLGAVRPAAGRAAADTEPLPAADPSGAGRPAQRKDVDETLPHPVANVAADALRFVVLRPHATGGLGQVWVALDRELNREVALKEIRPEQADDTESRARFLLEAEVTGRLEHPGVVPVYGLGCTDEGRPFYAMRFIKGQSLKEAIAGFHHPADGSTRDRTQWNLGLRALLNRFIAVCNVVAYAHSRGVIHRDLKPSNILLGPYGETLVVDWGLAKVVGRDAATARSVTAEATLRPASQSGSSETLPGLALGTPAYMSPEQAEGRLADISPLSDVYSLGATLYTLLTGSLPFCDAEVVDVLRRVRNGEFVAPRQVNRHVPAALEAACLKAMTLRPQDRYDSALRLSYDVEHWLADEPIAVHREPWSTRLTRWGRRHRTLAAGIGVLLVTAVIGLALGNLLLGQANEQIASERALAEVQRTVAERKTARGRREGPRVRATALPASHQPGPARGRHRYPRRRAAARPVPAEVPRLGVALRQAALPPGAAHAPGPYPSGQRGRLQPRRPAAGLRRRRAVLQRLDDPRRGARRLGRGERPGRPPPLGAPGGRLQRRIQPGRQADRGRQRIPARAQQLRRPPFGLGRRVGPPALRSPGRGP